MTDPSKTSPEGSERRILVVDDDAVHRELVRRLLSDEYHVSEAATAGEALASVENGIPDLVLLDYRLPDRSGLEILEELHARGCTVIMLTGQGDEDVAVASMRGGAADYLTKERLDGDRLRRAVMYAFEHRSLEAAVRDSGRERALLAEAVRQAAEGIVVTDSDGNIELVNAAFEAQTGYAAEEVIGRNPSLLKSGEQDEAFYAELWSTVLGGGTWSGRMVNRRKDGSHYHIDATISPMKAPDGTIERLLAFQKDVTREVELEGQLRASQRLEALGHLAGGIAHDFNNLMTVVLGNMELGIEELDEADPLLPTLHEVKDAALAGRSLTKRLLAFGRKQVLNPKVLEINDVVSGMEGLVARVIGDDVELTVRTSADVCNVRADPAQLQSIVLNLCLNARDAMPDGGQLVIETSEVVVDEGYRETHPGAQTGRFAVLSVTDSGVGMDEETKRRVFEPFFTTKEEGMGSGLGLAMVYGTVKQSGGNIWVYSELGVGTTFKVYLPSVSQDVELVVQEQTPVEPRAAGRRILLVEDQEPVRRSVRRMLEAAGYEVEEAVDPAVALDRLTASDGDFDLLVSDVVMPGMSGLDLVDKVVDGGRSIRVLFVSGHSADVVFKRSSPRAPHAFLEKPFTFEELTTAVSELLLTP